MKSTKEGTVSKLIEAVEGMGVNFGDYDLQVKSKDHLEFGGDVYKVKSFYEITRLEINDVMVYESVPGTRVEEFKMTDEGISFVVEGKQDASITLGVEENTNFSLNIDGVVHDHTAYISPGKLNININFDGKPVRVVVTKNQEA